MTSGMSTVQSALGFIRRRFSDHNVAAGLTENATLDDDPVGKSNQNISPNQRRSAAPSPAPSTSSNSGFFASLTSGNPLSAVKPDLSEKKVLLVIDDQHTNWVNWFKGRKVCGDQNIKVEQAEFSEISVSSSSRDGCIVDINMIRNGKKVIKSFTPDFLLVRQTAKSMGEQKNYTNLLIGFKHGGIPSVNSLHSQYNFLDKPWTFSQLIRIQKKLGKDKFPLISQTFYPFAKQMLTSPHFPVIIKIGHAHRGTAKFKVHDHYEFQDVAGVAAMTGTYAVVEKFVDADYDVRIQKIGNSYKAYKRISVSRNWKSNRGSAMLEEIAVTDKYKLWVDACSDMFGGLDIVGVKVLHGKDGNNYITEVIDCSLMLMGDKQDEDRKRIVDLVTQRMNACLRNRNTKSLIENSSSQSRSQSQKRSSTKQKPQELHQKLNERSQKKQIFQQKSSANQPTAVKLEPLKLEQRNYSSTEKRSSVSKATVQQSTSIKNQSAPVSPTTIEAHSSVITAINKATSREEQNESQGAVSGLRSSFHEQGRAVNNEEDSKAERIRNLRQSFVNLFE